MAAITITAASLGIGDGAVVQQYEVGEEVTHGEVIYLDTANKDYRLADADAAATAKAAAVAVTYGSADGQTVLAITRGKLVIGSGLTQGTEYYLGTTPGTIVPKADLATGDYVTRIGIASSTSILDVSIDVTGVVLP